MTVTRLPKRRNLFLQAKKQGNRDGNSSYARNGYPSLLFPKLKSPCGNHRTVLRGYKPLPISFSLIPMTNKFPIEVIPFTPNKWMGLDMPENLPKIEYKVFKQKDGLLTLSLEYNDECVAWMSNVCPHHYRELIDHFWIGFEHGYDLAVDTELSQAHYVR